MLIKLIARNVKGLNMSMNFDNKRNASSSSILDKNLFRTFQLRANSELLRTALLPLTVLKLVQDTNAFKQFCSTLKEEVSSIEIDFFLFDSDLTKYKKHNYKIIFDNEGILEEFFDFELLVAYDDYFKSSMPSILYDYLDTLLVYDLSIPHSFRSLLGLAKTTASSKAFRDFATGFIANVGYEAITGITRSIETDELLFEFETSYLELEECDPNLQHLFAASLMIFLRPIVPGVVVLNNLDIEITEAQVASILEYINNYNLDNPMQLIFGTPKNYSLFPEQVIEIHKMNEVILCQWQNF